MKIVLIAIVIQAVSLPATETDPAVTAVLTTPVVAEYDDYNACAAAVRLIAKSVGDRVISIEFSCGPKAMGKLEVEKEKKPEPKPQLERREEGPSGSRT